MENASIISLYAPNQVKDDATQEVYNVNHRLDAYETVGAKGNCLRFDGYSNFIVSEINTDGMATKKLTFSLWCAPQAYPSITGMDAPGEEWTNIAGKFHGMPDGNWTNETHGLIYYGGKYHVFFQKNSNAPIMCHMHWGHITSTDLLNWKEEKVALMPLEDYEMKGTWSGCVFTDPDFNNGLPVIGYTSVDFAKASISTAYAKDETLLGWTKQGQVIPASPAGYSDFRDCYYFRANGKKYMIVGSGLNNVGATTLFEYNGSSWNFKGTFFKGTNKAEHGTYWEMPTITKMDDEGNYLFTCTPQGTSVGVKVICWIGKINNDGTFNPLTGPFDFEMAGTSKDGIGLLSPSICQKDGKTICLGIVSDKMARNIMLLVK